jgi:hypothetical protein
LFVPCESLKTNVAVERLTNSAGADTKRRGTAGATI